MALVQTHLKTRAAALVVQVIAMAEGFASATRRDLARAFAELIGLVRAWLVDLAETRLRGTPPPAPRAKPKRNPPRTASRARLPAHTPGQVERFGLSLLAPQAGPPRAIRSAQAPQSRRPSSDSTRAMNLMLLRALTLQRTIAAPEDAILAMMGALQRQRARIARADAPYADHLPADQKRAPDAPHAARPDKVFESPPRNRKARRALAADLRRQARAPRSAKDG